MSLNTNLVLASNTRCVEEVSVNAKTDSMSEMASAKQSWGNLSKIALFAVAEPLKTIAVFVPTTIFISRT